MPVDDPPQAVTESELINAIVAGDANATELFVRDNEPRIRRAVRDAGVPSADAPDVVQDIIIEAVRQLSRGQFAQRASLRTWIRTIAEGRIVDYRRAAGRRGSRETVSLEAVEVHVNSFASPAEQEIRLLVEDALDAMPVRHRIALVAHCRAGMPVEELARLFGLSVKRTRNIVTEAGKMFRSEVLGLGKTPGERRLQK